LVLTGEQKAMEMAGDERKQEAAVEIGVERLRARRWGKEGSREFFVERRRRGAFYMVREAVGRWPAVVEF
jgi:hypothetical protein